MKNIYLVGFMGSGKSTVGKLLSEKTGMEFVDIDQLIEKQEKRKISEIFEKEGEGYFRQKEKEMLEKISNKEGLIISTGGGLGADAENMKKMKQSGIVIWLDASIETILKRTEGDTERPLLKQPYQQLKKLYENRKKIYKMADVHINVDSKSPEEIVQEIMEKWKYIQV
ncbi:shikimate kinase [Persephonella atlantica]|uniref:Shikimate kinase n=1 Tax=Persephonella atlantica TaxID=2699429 RepID=A0ABS1GH06_9AQUI|nr:shikimate kinase [Persephonella atlantica]MBK3332199.1 shikimate kinase [Persephonella atlantica]